MKSSIFFLVFALGLISIFSSCKKKTKYTISGTLYQDCGQTIGATSIDVRQRSTAYVDYSGGSLKVIKTDKNGNFSYTYKQLDNGSTDISLFDGDGDNANLIMEGIPANMDVQLNLYRYKNVSLTYTIDYTTTQDSLYTRFDTLYIGGKPFAGPFRKGQTFGPISESQDVNFYGYETKDYTTCWGVTLPDFWLSTQSLGHYKEYHVIHYNMPSCGSVGNQVIMLK